MWCRMRRLSVPVGGKERFANGAEVRVKSLALVREDIIPSEVSFHEAEHVVPNPDNVEEATIVEGPRYRGRTKLRRFDPIAAAGPHANGRRGTGHDLMLIKLHGHNVEGAVGGAQIHLAGKGDHVRAVASLLEEKRTISGGEAKAVMEEVDLGKKVQVEISDPDGRKHEITERVKGDAKFMQIEMQPDIAYPLPKAA